MDVKAEIAVTKLLRKILVFFKEIQKCLSFEVLERTEAGMCY